MQLRPKHTVFRRVRDVRVDVREPAVGLEHWHAVTLLVHLTSEGTVRLDGKGQIKKVTIEAKLLLVQSHRVVDHCTVAVSHRDRVDAIRPTNGTLVAEYVSQYSSRRSAHHKDVINKARGIEE